MSTPVSRILALLSVPFAGVLLVACGGSGGDAPASSKTSRLDLAITDSPVDMADEVWVQFRAVEFQPEEGEPVTVEFRDDAGNPAPRSINLLPLQDGRSTLLFDDLTLPAGNYQWLRMIVDNEPNVRDSYLMVEGRECELRIPSGDESGLKLQGGFVLPADGSAALTVDFDLRKSLRDPPGQKGGAPDCTQVYLMKPVLRLVRDSQAGGISGTVDPSLVPDEACSRMVYVFADGENAAGSTAPDDQDGTPADPVVMAKADADTGIYRASFLPAGPYTVAFTCGEDDLDADDSLEFTAVRGATVQAGLVTTGVDLPEPAG